MYTRNVYIAGAELGGWAFTANAIMVRLCLVFDSQQSFRHANDYMARRNKLCLVSEGWYTRLVSICLMVSCKK